jgi:hypothetical protein
MLPVQYSKTHIITDGHVAAEPCRADYVKWLAATARSVGLDIGIKNSFQLVDRDPSLIALWDW